jgi:hypothetical protein
MLVYLSSRARVAARMFLMAALLLSVTSNALGWTLEQMLNRPYFERSDIKTVRDGGFGVARIHEVSDREIAVVIACLVQVPSEEALAPFLSDSLPVDPEHLRDQKLIDPDLPDKSFRDVSLSGDSRDEIRHYLEAHPGVGLNLSSDEISAFQALRDLDDPAAVESTLEDILHRRYLAYREAGLEGAIPYARENGVEVSPGSELRRTEEEMKGLHEIYPEFHNAWLRYPVSVPEDIVRDDYFWLKLDIEDRPAFVLSHRLEARNQNMHLVGIRDYYMSHFFDVSQRVAVVTRLESGEDVLIYLERAWVDYWSGLASLKKRIGRKVLTRQMEHLLQDHGICGR